MENNGGETSKRAFSAGEAGESQPPKRLKDQEQVLELSTLYKMGQDAGIAYIRGDIAWSQIDVIILKMQDLHQTCFFAGFCNSAACARELRFKDEMEALRRSPILMSTEEARQRGLINK
jgi:hypothetical protein